MNVGGWEVGDTTLRGGPTQDGGKGSLAKMRSSAWVVLSLGYVGESEWRGPGGSWRKVGVGRVVGPL